MTSFPPEAKVHEFWSWFASVAAQLGKNFRNSSITDELDTRLGELGQLVWELGPGLDAEHALVVSPDGDPERLPISRHIVALAPNIQGWEFHPARPPKQWELQFSIESDEGETIPIDARSWRYVMLKFPDGTFDVLFEQPNATEIDEGDRWTACMILLDGLLGEATRMAFIGDVEPVLKLPPDYTGKATPVSRMPEHFDSLFHAS
jgi:hypothetical protein